jgi:hypothetical protein
VIVSLENLLTGIEERFELRVRKLRTPLALS